MLRHISVSINDDLEVAERLRQQRVEGLHQERLYILVAQSIAEVRG
jgi:hypothetical protein